MALILPIKLSFSFLLLFVMNPFSFVVSRSIEASEHAFIKTLKNLEGVHKGQTTKGVNELKNYLKKFGYLTNDQYYSNDYFDETVESALKNYQTYHNLHVTGHIDTATIERMSLPRCGVADIMTRHKRNGLVTVANYTFFPGSPTWEDSKRALTYTYKSSANVLSIDMVREAVESAFQSWSKVTDFTFTEIESEDDPVDIVIGFHRGDHGDGYPFDGPGQVLAHTFAPEDGRLHCDADEKWTNNPNGSRRRKPSGFDLETVALHEIGHLIGLGHSSNPDSVMFPSYGGVRRDLRQDDVDGIHALYGYN
ncbi:metalloendoproteinase 1-like [Abrus precatorius]|uniref:Metalloendoproteinase 1-like n=1 Tax=Abrus precatorius TaxID=3816 RepID=A0A8B8LSL3_ABRPR|nr:metalloendoproteinase 1-like [Abrus precatorius]